MNIYLTDGTEGCFYTAAFSACTDRGCIVTSARTFQLPLGAQTVEVVEDEEKRERVRRKLRALDPPCLREIGLILRRGCQTREMTALAYLRRIVKAGGPVRDRLSDPAVLEAIESLGLVPSDLQYPTDGDINMITRDPKLKNMVRDKLYKQVKGE